MHRTAQIPVDALEVREIDGLWLAPLLTGLAEQIVRTLAVHIRFTPAREAKAAARRDVTTDQRDILARERKGQLVDDDTELALSSSARRMSDLREGVGHHGAHWAAFLTVSARTPADLVHRRARTWRPPPRTTPGSTASTGWTPSSPPRRPPPGPWAAA